MVQNANRFYCEDRSNQIAKTFIHPSNPLIEPGWGYLGRCWYGLFVIIDIISLVLIMSNAPLHTDLIRKLQQEVLAMQGFRRAGENMIVRSGLGLIEQAFPEKRFPTSAVHEFISNEAPHAAATNGFITGILGQLMKQGGYCLWVSTKRTVFPPALKAFGIDPDRVIFADISRPKQALWAIEECLKCGALTTVVGEIKELSFSESRRLQLAVEESQVTGFIHRYQPRSENTVACLSRWKIKAIQSEAEDGMPGPGFPRWQVELLKVRNGRPGTWLVEWTGSDFRPVSRPGIPIPEILKLKTG
jgi:protein ImuA